MKRMISIALVIGLVFATAGVSQARPNGGRGHGGGHFQGRPAVQGHQGFVARPGPPAHHGFVARPGFPAHRGFVRPGFAPHRHFSRGGVFVGVAPFVVGGAIAYGAPYYYDPGYAYSEPAYSAPAPAYWYYCQSAGGYYPDVPSCAEPWVPVPAQ